MSLSALQIRFNVQQRQDPLFTYVDFNQLNWPREGCAVCSLDLTTDPSCWKQAVTLAVNEIRRLGLYGLTGNELQRYKQAILSEAEQAAAQADQRNNEAVLAEVMDAEGCGHTYMHPSARLEATAMALDSISIDDVNGMAKELCEHLSHISPFDGVRPAAIIACAPLIDRNGHAFSVTELEVAETIAQALLQPLEPTIETIVPDTLITPEQLAAKTEITPPAWTELDEKAAKYAKNNIGVVQKKLTNGIRVNMISLSSEPQRANVRLYVPGGRMLENRDNVGSVLHGCKTIQEGSFLGHDSRGSRTILH